LLANDPIYQLRGHRVAPMQFSEIESKALGFCRRFGLTPGAEKRMGLLFDKLADEATITIDPICPDDWNYSTEAICAPQSRTIHVPEATYQKATRGDPRALEIMFHELGHVLLGHQPVHHHEGLSPPHQSEDAEWQADLFAMVVLKYMQVRIGWQLSLPFQGTKA